MKGIELIASLIAILFMLGISSFLGGIIIIVTNAVEQPSTRNINYEMYVSPYYPPIKYESMLLSYLEVTDASGIQAKRLLAYAAYQGSVDSIFIGSKEVTSLGSTTSSTFDKWIPTQAYMIILNVDGKPYIIAQNAQAVNTLSKSMLNMRKISVPIYIDRDSMAYGNKKNDLPLKATLDFYVQ
jgi:hypothetical protein